MDQKNEKIFPVDKNEQESMQQLAEKLDALQSKKGEKAEETITDDFNVDADKMKVIEKAESEMRALLKLIDVDYDDLIRMDGKSIYSRAVSANPAVLDYVKNAENPVLEAVKISLQFKPYAEFMEKYGDQPDDIFQNIKNEIEGAKGQQKVEVKPTVEEVIKGASFSGMPSGNSSEEKKSDASSLAEIFNK